MGNLGADASGTTHAFTFARRPFKGFVKAVCEATGASGTTADGDPSVNHLIIVDGGLTTGPLPPRALDADDACCLTRRFVQGTGHGTSASRTVGTACLPRWTTARGWPARAPAPGSTTTRCPALASPAALLVVLSRRCCACAGEQHRAREPDPLHRLLDDRRRGLHHRGRALRHLPSCCLLPCLAIQYCASSCQTELSTRLRAGPGKRAEWDVACGRWAPHGRGTLCKR